MFPKPSLFRIHCGFIGLSVKGDVLCHKVLAIGFWRIFSLTSFIRYDMSTSLSGSLSSVTFPLISHTPLA